MSDDEFNTCPSCNHPVRPRVGRGLTFRRCERCRKLHFFFDVPGDALLIGALVIGVLLYAAMLYVVET